MARVGPVGHHAVIVGIGVDVVDIARFAAALQRRPRLAERLFVPLERDLPPRSLAARFAAKEAVVKALGTSGLRWHDAWVVRDAQRRPVLHTAGTVAARADELGVRTWHLTLSHDGGLAVAMVVAEG